MHQVLGREPRSAEIAKHLDIPVAKVRKGAQEALGGLALAAPGTSFESKSLDGLGLAIPSL